MTPGSLATLANGATASVTLSGTTATVTVSNQAGSGSEWAQPLVEALAYENAADTPTAGNRMATLSAVFETDGRPATFGSTPSTVAVTALGDISLTDGSLTPTGEATVSNTLTPTISFIAQAGQALQVDWDGPATDDWVDIPVGTGTVQTLTVSEEMELAEGAATEIRVRLAGDDTSIRSFSVTPSLAPTAVALSTPTVEENAGEGTLVGTLTATDTNSDTATFTILGEDDSGFRIDGNQLQIGTGRFDHEEDESRSITVRGMDSVGNFFDQLIDIAITNV